MSRPNVSMGISRCERAAGGYQRAPIGKRRGDCCHHDGDFLSVAKAAASPFNRSASRLAIQSATVAPLKYY